MFTPRDISGYDFGFLSFYEKHIVAFEDHNKEGGETNKHYHVYIETSYGPLTVRNAVKANFKIPAGGKGKNNGYYSLHVNWDDIGYICKYGDIRSSKGFSEEQILEFVVSGKKKYLQKVEGGELRGEVAPAPRSEKSVKVIPQQMIISNAACKWFQHKSECSANDTEPSRKMLVKYVCDEIRAAGKGINAYQVRDFCQAVLYDDLDYRDSLLEKIALSLV